MGRVLRNFISALCLMLMASPAAAAWREVETDHFKIYSDGNDKELLRYADRLESVQYLLKAATGVNETKQRIVKVRVYFVADVSDVQNLYGRGGSDVAGFYHPSEDGAYTVVPRDAGTSGVFSGLTVLNHEYAHHFMLQYLPAAYPDWYVEGFAEIIGTASFENKGFISFGKAAKAREYELDFTNLYPIPKLIDGSYRKEKSKDRKWGYGQAWLMAHYLTFSDKRRGQLRQYLTAINKGTSYAEAASVFGDPVLLSREISIYLAGRNFPYKSLPLPEGLTKNPPVRLLSAGEAATVEDRIKLARIAKIWPKGNEEEQAKADARIAREKAERATWLAALRAKANQYASDPEVIQLLADSECMAEEYVACDATVGKVLALSPNHPRALIRKADAIIGLAAQKTGNAREDDMKTARSLVVKANRMDPDDPFALIAYFRTFAGSQQPIPDAAINGLVQAVFTMPQVDSLRIDLAKVLIAKQRYLEARNTLNIVAYSPHGSSEKKEAIKLLAEIESAEKSKAAAP
jgi:hypothetical protein